MLGWTSGLGSFVKRGWWYLHLHLCESLKQSSYKILENPIRKLSYSSATRSGSWKGGWGWSATVKNYWGCEGWVHVSIQFLEMFVKTLGSLSTTCSFLSGRWKNSQRRCLLLSSKISLTTRGHHCFKGIHTLMKTALISYHITLLTVFPSEPSISAKAPPPPILPLIHTLTLLFLKA